MFGPKWKSKNEEKALATVAQESDEEILAKIALEAPLISVAEAAAKKLTNQSIIREVLLASADTSVIAAVIKNFNDATIVMRIATGYDWRTVIGEDWEEANEYEVRAAAVEKIATYCGDNFVRCTELERLEPSIDYKHFAQSILKSIVEKNSDHLVRCRAIHFIKDETFLKGVAKNRHDDGRVRSWAIRGLEENAENQTFIQGFSWSGENPEVNKTATEWLENFKRMTTPMRRKCQSLVCYKEQSMYSMIGLDGLYSGEGGAQDVYVIRKIGDSESLGIARAMFIAMESQLYKAEKDGSYGFTFNEAGRNATYEKVEELKSILEKFRYILKVWDNANFTNREFCPRCGHIFEEC